MILKKIYQELVQIRKELQRMKICNPGIKEISDAGIEIKDKLVIDTRTNEFSLNGKDLTDTMSVTDLSIMIHDGDKITVSMRSKTTGNSAVLSPCEVDMHIATDEDGRIGWLLGI